MNTEHELFTIASTKALGSSLKFTRHFYEDITKEKFMASHTLLRNNKDFLVGKLGK